MSSQPQNALNPLAEAANATIKAENATVFGLLSERGKRFFFPAKGILAQGAEAKTKAKTANATIGIATESGAPMHLNCIAQYFQGLTPAEIYDYTPSFGKPDLRQAWAKKQREETPSLGDTLTSLPIVTNALTHGLAVIGDLFLDPGDQVLSSELMWENYNLSWETRLGAHINLYNFFDKKLSGFNLESFTQNLFSRKGRKLVVALNFPNNPSGYSPTKAEAGAIVNALVAAAQAGTQLVVVCDDAYYGMFYDPACETESLFGKLASAHENILAIKIDGATKEEFVWGFRVGFITYGVKGGTKALYDALEQKTGGLIRAVISSVSNPGQSIVLKALQNPNFRAQQAEKVEILRKRAAVTGTICRQAQFADCWDVYPFNSGYFMCLRVKDVEADDVRKYLLEHHSVGTIALGKTELRIAFSCLTEAQIPVVFQAAAESIRALRKK